MPARRTILALVCLTAAVGCEPESPTAAGPDQASLAATQGGPPGFQKVQVRSQVPNQARGAVTNNLADAVERVAPGGEIVVYPGEYVTEDVVIAKPMTIRGNGGPVIVNGGASTSLVVTGLGEGTVTIRELTFRDEAGTHAGAFAASIALDEDFGDVLVESSAFSGVPGETRSIYQRTATSTRSPGLTVLNSTFRDGNRAVHLLNAFGVETRYLLEGNDVRNFSSRSFYLTFATGVVRANEFSACGLSCVISQVATEVEIVDNRFDQCGSNTPLPRTGLAAACITVFFGKDALIRGNEISNRVTDRGQQFGIFLANFAGFGQNGRFIVEDNVIDGCGRGICILTDGETQATIRGNQVTAYPEDHTGFAVLSTGGRGHGTDVIQDNRFTGLGDPTNGEFGFQFGGIAVNQGNSAVVSENRISGAPFGLDVNSASVQGTDNVVFDVRHPLALVDAASIDLTASDLVGFISPIYVEAVNGAPSGDLTCNWWGSADASGLDPAALPGVILEPFSTTPIAGTGRTTCSGTFPATSVTYEAEFEVTGSRYFGSEPSIAAELPPVGARGTVLFKYDPGAQGSGSSPTVYSMSTASGDELSFVFDGGLVWATTAGDHFEVRVVDRIGGADVVRFQSDDAEVPIPGLTTDQIYVSFGDLSGNAINDESLPTSIHLADWPSTNNIDLRAVDGTNSEFRIFAKVTSLTRVN